VIDFNEIFLNARPMLDVRAPVEFNSGAFPNATNIPILDDEQRHQVGICYMEQGAVAAEQLGHELIGKDKEKLIERWQAFVANHPDAVLYCARGGRRSYLAAEWLEQAGTKIPRIPGGYKALRKFLLKRVESPPAIVLLSGKTGVGKTELLPRVKSAVDLESLANHRGSAFGAYGTPQPAQIDFENALAIAFLKLPDYVVLEDESRLIGRINLPVPLQTAMKSAPICLLEDTIENRIERIRREYVELPLVTTSPDEVLASLLGSVDAIKNRLGGVRHKELVSDLIEAFRSQGQNDASHHAVWIKKLLTDYYDPMYEYQLDKKRGRIVQTIHWQDLTDDQVLDLGSHAT
jgi:tRNA 2-selenouridine synthase